MPLQQQPLGSPFDATSTSEQVLEGVDLSGKTVVLTGATAGLGEAAAKALAAAGARLILPVRSLDKGRALIDELGRVTSADKLELAHMELGDWSSVRAFADDLVARGEPIHVLIDNAGLMPANLETVDGGVEAQFGANHLGHMLLTCRLAPLLLKGAPARVVTLSSAAHRRLPARFDDINFETRPYDKLEAYAIVKAANSLFAVELNRRLEARGVTAYSVNPGPVFTAIQTAFSPEEMKAMKFHEADGSPAAWFRSTSQGASTIVWCATSPLLEGQGGVYCEDCDVSELRTEAATGTGPAALTGVRPWAVDPALARELWTISEQLLGERFDL